MPVKTRASIKAYKLCDPNGVQNVDIQLTMKPNKIIFFALAVLTTKMAVNGPEMG